uniref:EF-hand calcium binding domain 14 n=1 Tax=Poecilia latipinna TaxID=48699 RepID=A0A3B3U335_9TELE
MKKRKELNALIGLGDSKRKKTKKGSGHRLLRTEPPGSESESSSEDDDFNNLNGGTNFGKRSYSQCCNVCYPLFLFIILAACVMACAGLIWMQIALKEDLDSLKEKLHSMESSQKVSSSEIPKMSEDLKNKEKKLEDIENGDKGLSKLWSNLTEMNRKITSLDSAVNHLTTSLKSSPGLIGLPTTVEELQKVKPTEAGNVKYLQTPLPVSRAVLRFCLYLKRAMGEVNKTEEQHHMWTDEQIHILLSTVADLHQRVASLENGSKHSVSHTLILWWLNLYMHVYVFFFFLLNLGFIQTVADDPNNFLSVWREHRYLFKLQSVRVHIRVRITAIVVPFLKHTETPSFLFLLLNSFPDLEGVYQRAGVGRDSLGLTHQDLKMLFGTSTPSERALACFDDGDRRYSLVELRAAVGL